MALTKHELALEIEAITGIKPNLVKHVFDALATIAAEEIEDGEDFTVPGIVKIRHNYTAPLKKGEKYKKGETYVGFGGAEITAVEDSKARAEKITTRPYLLAAIKTSAAVAATKGKPGYKNVVARKKK